MIHTTKIYLVTNCYGDQNKVYIGKTKNCRKNNHKQTYGSQIIYTYIDEVESLYRKDWGPLESYWIEQFIQWGFKVVNICKKGGSGVESHTEQTKLKMKQPRSTFKKGTEHGSYGIPKTEYHKQNLRKIVTNTENFHKPKTEEHKQNMRVPKNHGDKLSKSLKGKKRSEEQIQNIIKGHEKKLKVTNIQTGIIVLYNSIKDASIKIKKSRTMIWNYIHMSTPNTKNEVWEFLT